MSLIRFGLHSGLSNFQTNITKWVSLIRVIKIHVRLSRLMGVKQKSSHWDWGMNNSFFHSSQPRNQVWILVIQNWPIWIFWKKNCWYYKCKPLIVNQPLHSFRDSGFPVKWRLRNQRHTECVTTQTWVVLLIGWKFASLHQNSISALVLQTLIRGRSVPGSEIVEKARTKKKTGGN